MLGIWREFDIQNLFLIRHGSGLCKKNRNFASSQNLFPRRANKMSKLRNSLKISGTRRSEQIITVWMWFCCLNWSQIRLIPVYTLHKTIIKISFIYRQEQSRAETGGTGQGPSLWKGCIKILDGPMKTNWGLELFGLIGRARFFYKSSHWEQ